MNSIHLLKDLNDLVYTFCSNNVVINIFEKMEKINATFFFKKQSELEVLNKF